MAITHVIRGDDHLTNTFRQIQVYRAMGWELPAVRAYPADPRRRWGEIVEAARRAVRVWSFASRDSCRKRCATICCGWVGRMAIWRSLDREEAIRLFDIVDVNRGASRMDYAKLTNLNGIYIRQADDERLTEDVLERLAHRPDVSLGSHRRGPHSGADAGLEGTGEDAGGAGGFGGLSGPGGAAADGAEGSSRF